MASGLPYVPVHDVLVHPREGDLVVATHGRSVYVAEAAPLRKLTAEVRAKTLHAFPIKAVKSGADRGYGDHPWITWRREDVVARIAYWSKDGAPATVAIKDENGSLWREQESASLPGMNVVEFDLSVDPKLADAAEAIARTKARQKQAAAKSGGDKAPAAADPAEAEEDEDEEAEAPPEQTSSSSGKAMLDPALERLLADPLRSTRRRFLPPGRYTVEVRSSGATAKSRLTIKAPKDDPADGGGRPKGP
jgi:hypothetical protein